MSDFVSTPLAELYDNNVGITQLVYPSDLGSARKGHWITFTISTPTKSTYNKVDQQSLPSAFVGPQQQNVQNLLNSFGNSITNTLTTSSGSIQSIPDFLKALGKVALIPIDIINIAAGSQTGLPYTYTVTPGTTKINTVIALYTPDTVSTGQHSAYKVESMTEALGVYGQAAAGGTALESMIEQGDFGPIKSFGIEMVNDILTGKSAVGQAALKSQGVSTNPQMEVFFSHIDFRTFQFDFLFTPKSEKEAETVKAIIKAFKFHSAPEVQTSGGFLYSGGRYFIVPSIFEIQMYKDGKSNENVNKYGVCACETVQVDYAPQGWVTHEDGMPVQTRLTLQFKEMEIMTKDKIQRGY